MLAIQEGQYTYPVYIEEEDNDINIYIGNAKRTKAPCIHIWIHKKSTAILEDLVFLPHCSASEKHLHRGDGSVVIMLKSVLKWLLNKYHFVNEIEFIDESCFHTRNGLIRLPEKGVLTEGKTWYMKHFDAEPLTSMSIASFERYRAVHDSHRVDIITLDKDIWLEKNLEVLYSKFPVLNGKKVTGTPWKITAKTIKTYDVNPIEVQIGGGQTRGEYLKHLYLKHKRYDRPRRVFLSNLLQ